MSIQYYLRKPFLKDGSTYIKLFVQHQGIRYTKILKDTNNRPIKVYPTLWNNESQRINTKSNLIDKEQTKGINQFLDSLELDLSSKIRDNQFSKADISDIRVTTHFYTKVITKEENNKDESLYLYIKTYVSRLERGIIKNKGKDYSDGTITHYKQLEEYIKRNYKGLSFSDISKSWYESFVYKLSNEGKNLHTLLSKLQVILRSAYEDGLSNNDCFRSSWFTWSKGNKSNKTEVYLTEKDLQTLYTHHIQPMEGVTIKTLEKARDIFLIGCYTGLRISDNVTLNKSNFVTLKDGLECIKTYTKKTDKEVIVPILYDELRELLHKYDYELPSMSPQRVNQYIKVLCSQIEDFHKLIDIRESNKNRYTQPLYELITTHTGRRSFITNLSKKGYTSDEIKVFTGHSKVETLQKYIKMDKEERVQVIINKRI